MSELGRHHFAVHAWIDSFGTWRRDLSARVNAGQDASADLLTGAELMDRAAGRARGEDKQALTAMAGRLRHAEGGLTADVGEHGLTAALAQLVFGDDLAELARRYPDRSAAAASPELTVLVDRERARFSTWYELFPRSASPDRDRPGTLADVEARLPYLNGLGIDVLYLPPIHPIGTTNRKGDDGAPTAGPGEPGSPWAIGAADGGHTSVHPPAGVDRPTWTTWSQRLRPAASTSPSTSPSSARPTTLG